MASVALTTSSGSVTYANTGSFITTGQWISGEPDSIMVGAKKHLYSFPTMPGVNGAASKDFGTRERDIRIKAVYVNSSENGVASVMQADEDTLNVGPATVTIAGQIYKRAFLKDFAKTNIKQNAPGGTFWAAATISLTLKE